MEPAGLRAHFPVLRPRAEGGSDIAYLNAGTCGPLADTTVEAARAMLDAGAAHGRAHPFFERMLGLQVRQRAAYAARLGTAPENVALTTSTSEGMVRVLAGMDLGPEDEVITSDQEHPGLLGPLGALHRRTGAHVRIVPFAGVAEAVGPATRMVACSHVSWVGGEVAPAELREVAASGVPVLLDGAQGAGAVAVDVDALGCTFYGAAGQKWMCGAIGSGMLYVAPSWQDRLPPIGPTYLNLVDAAQGLAAEPHPDARRHDASALAPEGTAAAVAADELMAEFGWEAAGERAAGLASWLVDELRARGREVAPRGRTTLVSWVEDDPAGFVARAGEAGIVIRNLPGWPYVRASVGAWNDERDLERLLGLVS
ncbi:aminotransferase class V-fold PLP-dependent enzyme [Capillimicrobium parvum]|uniref:Cysteine desulfurase SufS n=1 Tax=Capillimicrobium parvum TaxID=2884022 RepID=A0A9E6XXT7_9ACTN|nr:aminotransferase class V-fold PLP-dependent enzyme [Capillimicrobium parvum]UGS36205.1 Cysteine desulfurase SufS [Capillimicrobium parvum]